MNLPIFKLDAFASETFTGNPAAVCPLAEWLPDALMQQIAAENNLSETAFFVATAGRYALRWFTPAAEVDLCGHATLASAHVIMTRLEPALDAVAFDTRSGALSVTRQGDDLVMDFPSQPPQTTVRPDALAGCFDVQPAEVLACEDLFLVFQSEAEVRALRPDFARLCDLPLRGVIVTAPGAGVDFVSRFFAPKVGVDEDPVTGSAHCALAPYWAERLGKRAVTGHQLSPRSGVVRCVVQGARVSLAGRCVDYLQGTITVPATG